MAIDRMGTGLAILRIFIGVFLLFEGISKLAWFMDTGPLSSQLAGWAQNATPMNDWYLQRLVPYVPILARVVVIGELGAGLALILGLWTSVVAALAFLMVLNFHVASGALFRYNFLTNGYGLPVLGGLLGLAIGGQRLPWSWSLRGRGAGVRGRL